MARSAVAISLPRWPAPLAAALVASAILGPLVALLWLVPSVGGMGPADWAAVRFTVLQAAASATISILLAVPVARALARREFIGKAAVLTLLGAPFVLPVIVAVLGLLAVFGRSGLVNQSLAMLGLPTVDIYGAQGVVLAHVFLNLPLATRVLVQGWAAVPAEHLRLAASLNGSVFRLIELPMLRRLVPGLWLVIALLCLSSFAVALILGGGPKATTIELAIYQAIRFQFDIGHAAVLAIVQLAISAGLALAVTKLATGVIVDGARGRTIGNWQRDSLAKQIVDMIWIGAAVLFVAGPILLILLRGGVMMGALPDAFVGAMIRSLCVAAAATTIALALGLALCIEGGRWAALAGVLPLMLSGLVLGTGMFVIANRFVDPALIGLPVTALANGLAALPFVLRSIGPQIDKDRVQFGRLSASLGVQGWQAVRIVLLPRLRRPLCFAAGLTAAMSMGDLGVIALFSGHDQATLPLLMLQLMGSYQNDAAAAVAAVLVLASLLIIWVLDWGGRGHAAP